VPHTLLLADDSVTIQRVIELTFADEDITVVPVSDGDQAIARLAAASPDIVLADVGMPGKNGYEVAQYVKQTPHLAHIPVVLLTGAFEPVDQVRALAAGCDGVLAKPFEPQLVIARVKELLARGADRGATPALVRDHDTPAPPPPSSGHDWTPAPAASGPAAVDLENYFDRLDAAFADLSNAPTHAAATPDLALAPESSEASAAPGAAVPDEIDWFGSAPEDADAPPSLADQIADATPATVESERQARAPEAPRALEAPQAPVALQAPEAPRAPEAPAFTLPTKPVALPSLADAFAALLAAEQGDVSAAPVAWPVNAPSMDTLADQISRRVLDQISPRIEATVRGAVGELVTDLAERLIREEIDRIKSAIK
jgi:CheY-like chemotaxis protein